MQRNIVHIDEELCDGCGLCLPSCAEGALKIINGKAKLIADKLCDGMGACLGHCPQGAIRIEIRDADDFDEAAVAAQGGGAHSGQPAAAPNAQPNLAPQHPALAQAPAGPVEHGHGCPGSRFMQLGKRPAAAPAMPPAAHDSALAQSELTHWPVQLRLLSPQAPVLKNAALLLAADCVPVAYRPFHEKLLRGRAVVISCPKFDDPAESVERLAQIIRANDPAEITVARMIVPCCSGILHAALRAREAAGSKVPIREVTIGLQGEEHQERIH